MPTKTLYEYTPIEYTIGDVNQILENKIEFTKRTFQELKKLNKKKKFLEISNSEIKPLNYVGVVKIGEITLEILPKFASEEKKDIIMKNLLKMLEYTDLLIIKDIDLAELLREKYTFFEVFIYLFAANLLDLIKKKRYLEYVLKSDDIRFIKGKINFQKLTNPARLHIIPCTYYDRQLDNPINRTLKYTSYIMSRIVENRKTYRKLRQILSILDPVPLTPVTTQVINNITFNRLNKDFKQYINICKIFLENATLTLQASKIRSFSLLIPMEKLFEQFIANVIKKEQIHKKKFGEQAILEIQKPIGHLLERDGKKIATLIPDITIIVGDTKIIIDTKYKLLDPEDKKPSQQDLYQIYTYCKEAEARKAILLYPQTSNFTEENLQEKPYKMGKDKNIDLYIKTIPLDIDLTKQWKQFTNTLNKTLNINKN